MAESLGGHDLLLSILDAVAPLPLELVVEDNSIALNAEEHPLDARVFRTPPDCPIQVERDHAKLIDQKRTAGSLNEFRVPEPHLQVGVMIDCSQLHRAAVQADAGGEEPVVLHDNERPRRRVAPESDQGVPLQPNRAQAEGHLLPSDLEANPPSPIELREPESRKHNLVPFLNLVDSNGAHGRATPLSARTAAGREWRPKGEPERVKVHDFIIKENGKAIPYGIYDPTLNKGYVSVGVDHDTASFAVQTIRRWWQLMGRRAYPGARSLLVTADSGGSNGARNRLWKLELQRFADRTGLTITVLHFPPGTSKWNKIEHRLFSYITANWRGHPLTSVVAVVNLIGSTKTTTGLRVRAEIDNGQYPKGVRVPEKEMLNLRLRRHRFHGDWNYTLRPRTGKKRSHRSSSRRPCRSRSRR